MSFRRIWPFALIGLLFAAFLVYLIPSVKERVDWRVSAAVAYVRNWLVPVGDLPAPEVVSTQVSADPTVATITPVAPTATLQFIPTPLPAAIQLTPPAHETQGPNNCGPATLAMYLRYYGWEGTQEDIAEEIKPISADRNVNPDELKYYADNWAGYFRTMFRVGGDIELLKQLLAAGFPVMIEEGEIILNQGPNDDNWAAHYLLLTGYDDATGLFTYQDSFRGANQTRTYNEIDEFWQQFNRIYFLVYLPEREEELRLILGDDWDEAANRQHALEVAQTEINADPSNAYVWFNLGMNQVFFEDYGAAAASFDQARTIGLPMRMLRYQFGPFFAYYNINRMDDLVELIDYALAVTPNSEDVLLWRGWALVRQGDTNGAIEQFRLAQEANPKSFYVTQALNFMGVTP